MSVFTVLYCTQEDTLLFLYLTVCLAVVTIVCISADVHRERVCVCVCLKGKPLYVPEPELLRDQLFEKSKQRLRGGGDRSS